MSENSRRRRRSRSASRRRRSIGNSKSFGSSKAARSSRLSTKETEKASFSKISEDALADLGDAVDAILRFDANNIWNMATNCVRETKNMAEQLATGHMNFFKNGVDINNLCQWEEINFESAGNNEAQSWIPNTIIYVEGEDNVSTDLTWNRAYNISTRGIESEPIQEETEQTSTSQNQSQGTRSQKRRERQMKPAASRDSTFRTQAETASIQSSTMSTEIPGSLPTIADEIAKFSNNTKRSIRRSVFKAMQDDSTRSVGRSLFNGVKAVQSKGSQFFQRRRQRRHQGRNSVSSKVGSAISSQ